MLTYKNKPRIVNIKITLDMLKYFNTQEVLPYQNNPRYVSISK